MADLVLNVNIFESKKKGRVVLETFDGTIPNLKSKQFSGPLRNININGISSVDNLTSLEFELIKKYLNSNFNTQINKYQYILSNSGLYELSQFVKKGCLFYKDKGTPMFQIEDVCFKPNHALKYVELIGVKIAYAKTNLFFLIENVIADDTTRQIAARAYVDINSKPCKLEVVFDYDDFSVNYEDDNRTLGNENAYRDFGFEERIITIIKKHGWVHEKNVGFKYEGRSLQNDLMQLIDAGIIVYTDSNSRIVKGDFSSIHISYGIDWFEIKGSVEADDESINISDLINLKGRKENWIEYNGKILFIPESLKTVLKPANLSGDTLRIDRTYLISAIEIAYDTNGGVIAGIEQLTDYSKICLNIDSNIFSILRPYQITGVKWLMSLHNNEFGGCLADDMGLGKTLQIIAYLSDSCMNKTKNLVIVPKTLLINWKKEFEKFSPKTPVYIYHGVGRDILQALESKIIVTTYGTILNDLEAFDGLKFDNIIIDEAQHIKNPKTKIYRAIKQLNAKTRIILTGTPVENNIQEYWGLMKLINPLLFSKTNPFVKNVDSVAITDRIKRITAPFLLRRMKKEVLLDLPQKQEQVLYCKMDCQQQELYNKMLSSIRNEIQRKSERFEIKSNSIMLNGLLYLEEICCHPQLLAKEYNPDDCRQSAKFEQLLDILSSLYSSNHKVVIFSRFTRMLKIIENKLIKLHYNTFYLDGKSANRMKIVEDFESSDNGIFLISLKAGGTGLNLISADTAIIYDPWWNPAIEKQAEDRIYRIGQTKNVIIYKMIVEGTIEEKIQTLQNEKNNLYEEILCGHEMPTSMTAEVMKDLLMG